MPTCALAFPDSLDEAGLDAIVQEVLEGIDRDLLMQCEGLVRAHHPLLHKRMGAEVTLNAEIYYLVTNLVTLYAILKEKISHPINLSNDARSTHDTLLYAAKNPDQMQSALVKLVEAVVNLAKFNPEEHALNIRDLVSSQIKKRLPTPNEIQELVLYPPVIAEISSGSKDGVLDLLDACKERLLQQFAGSQDDADGLFSEAVEIEAAMVKEWFSTSK